MSRAASCAASTSAGPQPSEPPIAEGPDSSAESPQAVTPSSTTLPTPTVETEPQSFSGQSLPPATAATPPPGPSPPPSQPPPPTRAPSLPLLSRSLRSEPSLPRSSSSRIIRRATETDSEIDATPPAGAVLPTPSSLPPPLLPPRLPPILPHSPYSPSASGSLRLMPMQSQLPPLSPPLSLSPPMPPPRRVNRNDKMAVRNLICDSSQPAIPLSVEAADELVAASSDDRILNRTNSRVGNSANRSSGGSDRNGSSQRQEPRAKRPWTGDEDLQLRGLVSQFGQGLWAAIAAQIPGRSGKQVRERWLNHLSPHVTKRPWSAEEDALILDSHRRYGNCWSKIAKLLEGRSDNSVKNRFYTTLKRRLGSPKSPAPPTSSQSPPQTVVAGAAASAAGGSTFGLVGEAGIVKKRRSGKLPQPSEQVEITKPRYKPARVWE